MMDDLRPLAVWTGSTHTGREIRADSGEESEARSRADTATACEAKLIAQGLMTPPIASQIRGVAE
jgi:hypothetical protein